MSAGDVSALINRNEVNSHRAPFAPGRKYRCGNEAADSNNPSSASARARSPLFTPDMRLLPRCESEKIKRKGREKAGEEEHGGRVSVSRAGTECCDIAALKATFNVRPESRSRNVRVSRTCNQEGATESQPAASRALCITDLQTYVGT